MSITTGAGTRLCGLLIAALCWLSADAAAADAPPASAPSQVAALLARHAEDPDAAVAALTALRSEPAHPEATEAGIALIELALVQRRSDDTQALAESLLAQPSLSPEQTARVLIAWQKSLYAARNLAQLAELETRVQALASDASVSPTLRADTLHQLMALYTQVPRFADALAVIGQILDLAGPDPTPQRLNALNAKGAVHAMQGQNDLAIEALLEAERVVQGLGRADDPSLLRNLAGIFINLGEFDRAIGYAERGEAAQRAQQPPPSPAARKGMLSVLATAHIGAGHFDQASRWSRESIAFGRAHDLPITGDLNNYATLLRDAGRHTEALAIYQELAGRIAPNDPPEIRGVLEKNIGETLVALERRSEAAGHLQTARRLYEQADVRPRRLELYPVLIDNLEALGRVGEALAAMREFKALSDETITAESKTRIGELEAAIDLERQNQALAEAEAANAVQRSANQALRVERERARSLNLALLASMLAMVVLLALLWRSLRIGARNHRLIQKQSREDSLTGLGNRRRLQEAMRGDRLADSLLVMADLDHFKRINDQHGHDAGDRALRHFADALRSVARHDDVVVRWGGEEFVWLCRGTAIQQAGPLCERLQQQLREHPLSIDGRIVPITASLGVAPLPVWSGTEANWENALRIADHAVYRAKAEGRNRWTGYVGTQGSRPDPRMTPAEMEDAGLLQRLGA